MMVEIVVASAIITGAVLAFITVAQKAIYISRQSFHVAQASFLLEEGAEAVRIMRDNNWNNISALTVGATYYPVFTSGTWTLSTTPNTVGSFTRTVVLADVNRDNTTQDIAISGTNDADSKKITITVFWLEGGTTVTKTLTFYIMKIFS